MSPPKSTSLIVPGPTGDLDVLLDEPNVSEPEHVAVICHPHPLMGGTMTNKVVHILARTFNELHAPAVRFNFRGVGRSAGSHDDGRGETEDALAMVRWTEERWPNAGIWLAGFSFGAAMALRAALSHPVERLVTVAPALKWLTQIRDEVPTCPWLIAQGDRDDLVDVEAVRAWVRTLRHPPRLEILPGAEHFFHGRLNDLRAVVTAWMSEKKAEK